MPIRPQNAPFNAVENRHAGGQGRAAEVETDHLERFETHKTPSITKPLSPRTTGQLAQYGQGHIPAPIDTQKTVSMPGIPRGSDAPYPVVPPQMRQAQGAVPPFPAVPFPYSPTPVLPPPVAPRAVLPPPSLVYYNIQQRTRMSKSKALLLIALLAVIVLQALTMGPKQFLGAQGWAYVLAGPAGGQKGNLLGDVGNQLHKPGAKAQATVSPTQYIDLVASKMTLDQKLGQMLMVQFTGAQHSIALSTMITQYDVGSVLLLQGNGNIVNKDQLLSLTQQMRQDSASLPLTLAIDQEGGSVDRMAIIDGAHPSAASIGATNDPAQAITEGNRDANDLSAFGININLAPVVDVDNQRGSEEHLDERTFGTDPATVAKMAGAYLQGLQQSGKVIGTLKHFPGLGDVIVDPHVGLPTLYRSKQDLEAIDWAPYHTLIQQGAVHAIMVTHERIPAIDSTRPASLSQKIVEGILRNEMGFQGVIMTDSLTMQGISAYYPEGQAAALAVEAGSDLIMGAASPDDVATMISGIKEAMNAGAISQQRIDDSVRRVLMMKYELGLITIPKN